MLAHVLLSLLVFEHGFIQIRFDSFEFFTRYLFYEILHDIFSEIFSQYLSQFLLLMRNITRWMLDTEVKVFHESISYFMKWPWNCISWNALKEKFHSVSFPLQQKCKIKGGTRVWRLRNMCLAWHSYKFRTYFSSLSILWKKNCLEKMWGGAKAPSARPAGVVGPEKTIETVIK